MKERFRLPQSIRLVLPKAAVVVSGAGVLLVAIHTAAQSAGFTLVSPTPGGIDSHPYITSITETQGILIRWFGFQGPYQVQGKSALDAATWTDLGNPTNGNATIVPKSGVAMFHRIRGGLPPYTGNNDCGECHGTIYETWSQTRHANAFQTLKDVGQQNNPECVVCHTVGANVPSGFINETTTPQFANVQCENCHGPAGNHLGSGDPPTLFPIVTRSAMLCGGCHNDFHHPTYDEWSSSPHSAVIEELVGDFSSTNRATAISRMSTCGACHSGGVRLAMVGAYNAYTGNARTNVSWPSGFEATNTPITCIVCHDQHATHKYTNVLTGALYTNQLRYPLTSTNVFTYNPCTNFASQYT